MVLLGAEINETDKKNVESTIDGGIGQGDGDALNLYWELSSTEKKYPGIHQI